MKSKQPENAEVAFKNVEITQVVVLSRVVSVAVKKGTDLYPTAKQLADEVFAGSDWTVRNQKVTATILE